MPNELELDGYDLIRLDWLRKCGGVPLFKFDFVYIYLPKTKPTRSGVLYRLPEKSDFVQH